VRVKTLKTPVQAVKMNYKKGKENAAFWKRSFPTMLICSGDAFIVGICHILLCVGVSWSSGAERGGLNFVDPD